MVTLVGVGLVVAAIFAIWLCSRAGRSAAALLLTNPALLLPPIAVGLAVRGLWEMNLGEFDKVLFRFKIPGLTFAPSAALILTFLIHIAGTASLLWLLSRRIPGLAPAPLFRLLISSSIVLTLAWVLMFSTFVPLAMVGLPAFPAIIFLVVLPVAALFLILNIALAPLAGTLPPAAGRLLPALRGAFAWLRSGGWRRIAFPVFVRLLVSGWLTVIWLNGYATTQQEWRGTSLQMTTTTHDVFNVNAKTYLVLNLSLDNAWEEKVADALEVRTPTALAWAIGLATALASTLFLTAFAQIVAAPERANDAGPPIV